MTPEVFTALGLALASAITMVFRKSKCFVRKIGPGIQYGIGFTDRALLPGTPDKAETVPHEMSLKGK